MHRLLLLVERLRASLACFSTANGGSPAKSLSGKSTYTAKLAVDDQTDRHLNEPLVVRRLLFPADQQAAEAVEPTAAHCHHPASWRISRRVCGRRQRMRRAATPEDVRDVSVCLGFRSARRVVVAPIQTPMPRRPFVRRVCHGLLRHGNQRRVQQRPQFLHDRAVRSRYHHRQWNPRPSVNKCRLLPHFPRSVGFAPVASASPTPLFAASPAPFRPKSFPPPST